MAQVTDKQPSVLKSLDWWTIGIYIALLIFGWISVCGASYTYGDNDIFSLGARSGMQIVWICTSITLGFVLLMLDNRFYDTFSYVIYGILLLLLFATIFNPHEIKGSRSSLSWHRRKQAPPWYTCHSFLCSTVKECQAAYCSQELQW